MFHWALDPAHRRKISDQRREIILDKDRFPLQGKATSSEFYWFCGAPAEIVQVEKRSLASAPQAFTGSSIN